MKIDSATNIIKYEEDIVFKLRSLYTAYGYRPYKMSKFEEYDLYVRNRDFLVSESVITFNDTDGRLLALKPDVTLSIVKNSTDVDGFVNKVYYNENVYRVSSRTETYREIMQTGLECIGDIDTYNVIEVLSLAAKSLETISSDYVLDVSHMGIINGLLEMTGANDVTKSQIVECIASKNAHDLLRICNDNNIDEVVSDKLCKFISIYGNMDTVINKLKELDLGEWASATIDELQYISDAFESDHVKSKLRLDFSIANGMSYYNGIVFKGYINGIPDSVLSGGRYDRLLKKMGRNSGAIGFAVYLDVLEYMDNQNAAYDVDVLLLYNNNVSVNTVMATVKKLTSEYSTVTAQKTVPAKLKYKSIAQLSADGSITFKEGNV